MFSWIKEPMVIITRMHIIRRIVGKAFLERPLVKSFISVKKCDGDHRAVEI